MDLPEAWPVLRVPPPALAEQLVEVLGADRGLVQHGLVLLRGLVLRGHGLELVQDLLVGEGGEGTDRGQLEDLPEKDPVAPDVGLGRVLALEERER